MPGEADEFCVRLAKSERDACIVSSDGDFLVHVGEEGQFIPLQTFPLTWDKTLSLSVYSEVRDMVGLKRVGGMVELAALLAESVSLTAAQCVQCVNQRQTLEYICPATLYRHVLLYTIHPTVPVNRGSEYMNRADMIGRMTEMFEYDEIPVHWLPLFPITNPPRKSPWLVSRSIRQAAYYRLHDHGLIRGEYVIEMIRRGERMVEDATPIEKVPVKLHGTSKNALFVYAMEVLLEHTSKEEMRLLPTFAEMISLIGSKISPVHVVIPPSTYYLTFIYQSIIYSLIIYLQSSLLLAESVPEFSSLWDLSLFKVALTASPSRKESAWTEILSQMDRRSQAIWQSTSKSTKKKAKLEVSATEVFNQVDNGNPFSTLFNSESS